MTNTELEDIEAALRRGAAVDVDTQAAAATISAIAAADRQGLIDVAVATVESPVGDLLVAATPIWADDGAVKIGNLTFGPQELKVKAGTTVTWTNEDDMPHTVVSPNNFRSKVLDTKGDYSFTFTTPGTYKYFCSLHPHMTGTIIVEATTGSDALP